MIGHHYSIVIGQVPFQSSRDLSQSVIKVVVSIILKCVLLLVDCCVMSFLDGAYLFRYDEPFHVAVISSFINRWQHLVIYIFF